MASSTEQGTPLACEAASSAADCSRPHVAAALDAPLCDEPRPVFVPGHRLLGRTRHRLDDGRARFGLFEDGAEGVPLESVPIDHLGDEAGHVRALPIERVRRARRHRRRDGEQRERS